MAYQTKASGIKRTNRVRRARNSRIANSSASKLRRARDVNYGKHKAKPKPRGY